jgi:hypothetical protein
MFIFHRTQRSAQKPENRAILIFFFGCLLFWAGSGLFIAGVSVELIFRNSTEVYNNQSIIITDQYTNESFLIAGLLLGFFSGVAMCMGIMLRFPRLKSEVGVKLNCITSKRILVAGPISAGKRSFVRNYFTPTVFSYIGPIKQGRGLVRWADNQLVTFYYVDPKINDVSNKLGWESEEFVSLFNMSKAQGIIFIVRDDEKQIKWVADAIASCPLDVRSKLRSSFIFNTSTKDKPFPAFKSLGVHDLYYNFSRLNLMDTEEKKKPERLKHGASALPLL